MAQAGAQSIAPCPETTSTNSGGSGQFGVLNGQIYGPNDLPFVARGVDVMEGQQPSAATLQSLFPGINFVRLAIYDYANPAALSAYVNDLTSHGIVVEIEDHNNNAGNAGGASGAIFSGQALTNELSWYSSVATAFKSNPYVWFGTNNEPSETDSSGNMNPGALSDWQLATYNSIRATGNNAPIMLEANGWANSGQPVMLQGYKVSDYASMTNTIWDVHYYGWLTNYSTDQATVGKFLSAAAQQAQQLVGAGGVMPVIVGEYGPSTQGANPDANATQVIQAVQQSGYGSVAWTYGSGPEGSDYLLNTSGGLSSFGQAVQAYIKNGAANPCQMSPQPPNAVPDVDVSTLNLPTAPIAPPSELSDIAPDQTFTPSGQTTARLTENQSQFSMGVPSAYGTPIQAPSLSTPSSVPLDYINEGSWWSRNPAAQAAERALCQSSSSALAAWAALCGMAGSQ